MALGKDAYKRHRYSEAIEHFQKASAIAPQSDLPFEWMAQTNDSRFDFNSAIGNALTTIKINPENENAHLILGHGYVMTGREREAVAILERAKELNPSDGEAYGYLSRAYSAIGNYDKALINDNSHVQIHWYEQRAFLQRADTLDALGRANEARYVRQLAEQVRQSTHH